MNKRHIFIAGFCTLLLHVRGQKGDRSPRFDPWKRQKPVSQKVRKSPNFGLQTGRFLWSAAPLRTVEEQWENAAARCR
jgi:hypothetical protein